MERASSAELISAMQSANPEFRVFHRVIELLSAGLFFIANFEHKVPRTNKGGNFMCWFGSNLLDSHCLKVHFATTSLDRVEHLYKTISDVMKSICCKKCLEQNKVLLVMKSKLHNKAERLHYQAGILESHFLQHQEFQSAASYSNLRNNP